jgi:hypothetical protein
MEHSIEDLISFYESEYDSFENPISPDALEYYKIFLYLKGLKIHRDHCR